MKKQEDPLPPEVLYSSAMQAGICDALRIIGIVLAGDKPAAALLKQSFDVLIAAVPERFGELSQNPLVMEGYKEPLKCLMEALHSREMAGTGSSRAH
ncbi:hypothetical protein M2401_000008 [Pseudomonas sp. JUb42]|uniref:hypothetical protein n=1 Tax=Pseudomonas sp. JUb42 TaxID=2940611 RepID=UPI00216A4B9E|nr:hypothetical protein [Pseudomonas sp. JUb42]MCS3466298.1 hypothetical protein [Pseudomonas sp. JUb42]